MTVRLVSTDPSAYGLTSMLRLLGGVSRPTTVAALDSLFSPRRPHDCGTAFKYEISFFQRTIRRKFTPQTSPPSLKRIERNGIRISMVQPPSKSWASEAHSPFQFGLGCSLVAVQSNMPPRRLAAKPKPLRWS